MKPFSTWQMSASTLAAVLLVFSTASPALAQFQPSKPIEIVAHGGPGSGNDLFARTIASALEQEKLVPVRLQVTNKPGGGSTTASAYLASKAGDSHTLSVYTNIWLTDPLIQTAAKVHLFQTLTPVARSVIEPGLIVVRADAPFKTLNDFIEAAKAKPGSLKQSGGSITARENIVRQILMKQTGANWSFISFPSGSERLAALLGGHVNLMLIDPAEGMELVRSGKLRILAQLVDKRLEPFKYIPTVKEAGYELPAIPQVRGIVGPPDMPPAALAYYEGVLGKLSQTPTWKKYIADNLFEDGYLTASATRSFLQEYEGVIRVQMQTMGAKLVR